MKFTLRSLDGIRQIAELSGHAAEVLRLSQADIESILFTSPSFYDLYM